MGTHTSITKHVVLPPPFDNVERNNDYLDKRNVVTNVQKNKTLLLCPSQIKKDEVPSVRAFVY